MERTESISSRRDSLTSSECSEQNNEGGNQCKGSQQRTQAEKKMDRILANRRSARRSRERRKKLQQNLEISVAFLSKQNEELAQENNMLKQELQILISLVNQLTKQGPLTSNDLGLESLLQQIQQSANPSNIAVDNVNTAPTNESAVNPTAALLSGANEGLNALTPQHILALSQLLTNQNQNQNQPHPQLPTYFPS